MFDTVGRYWKAVAGAAVAGLGSLHQALDDGGVSAQEWIAVVIATLVAAGAVGVVKNRPT